MSKSDEANRNITLEFILASFVVVSPVLFGSVYPWAYLLLAGFFFAAAVVRPQLVFQTEKSFRPYFAALGIVFGFILIQALFLSKSPEVTQFHLMRWLALGIGFLLVQELSQKSIKRILILMLIIGLGECLYGLWQLRSSTPMVLWQQKKHYVHFLTGTYLNRNHLAGFLELSLGVNAGLLLASLNSREYWKASFYAAAFVLLFSGLLLTGSRGGIACFLLSLSFYILFLLVQRRKQIFGAGFLFLALVLLAFFIGSGAAVDRYLSLSENSHSVTGRFLVWKDTARMIADHPGAGIGLGAYSEYFPAYLSSHALQNWSHAHNDYLELISELGLPCFVILVGIFFFLFKKILTGLSAEHGFSPLLWGIAVSLTSFLLHSFVDFNLAIPANAGWMILLLAAAVRMLKFPGHFSSTLPS